MSKTGVEMIFSGAGKMATNNAATSEIDLIVEQPTLSVCFAKANDDLCATVMWVLLCHRYRCAVLSPDFRGLGSVRANAQSARKVHYIFAGSGLLY